MIRPSDLARAELAYRIALQADWNDGICADGTPHYITTPTDTQYRTVCRAYLRLREAVEGIEDYNAEHHLDTICAPCMRMVKDALRQALEETDETE